MALAARVAMPSPKPPDLSWQQYLLDDDPSGHFPRDARVLDVGCGRGAQLHDLRDEGCRVVGLDTSERSLAACRGMNLPVVRARAEALPFTDASMNGVLCKVVMPYVAEGPAFAEISRVLAPRGRAHLVFHGSGYYLRYLLLGPTWKVRVYGLRTLLNTWIHATTGRRLPGFLGDTLYQSRSRLKRHYRGHGLALSAERPSPAFLGLPVFLYHDIVRPAVSPARSAGFTLRTARP